jgi:hypothetical protein
MFRYAKDTVLLLILLFSSFSYGVQSQGSNNNLYIATAVTSSDDDSDGEWVSPEPGIELLADFINKIKQNRLLISQFMIENTGDSLLHWAVKLNAFEELKELLEYANGDAEEINITNLSDKTPLYYAVELERADCAKALVLAGADTNIIFQDSSLNIRLAYYLNSI